MPITLATTRAFAPWRSSAASNSRAALPRTLVTTSSAMVS